MKRSRITDDQDVNLDDLDASAPGGSAPADTGDGTNGDDAQDDELPEDDDPDDDAADDDAADGDDEGDDEGSEDDAAGGRRSAAGDDEPPRRGRENNTIRTLRAQLREANNASRTLTQRFDDFVARGGQQQRQQVTQETAEQRNARRSLLSAEERNSEDLQELRQLVTTGLHQTQLQSADLTDKASFDAKASSDPLYRKWESQVEAERARLAGLGQFVAREALLTFLVGKAALQARAANGGKTQKALARRRVERQTVKAGNSRNDAAPSRRGSRSLEQRLEDVPL